MATITGYLGKGEAFDQAIGDYAVGYADQVERDYATFIQAIRDGQLKTGLSRSQLEATIKQAPSTRSWVHRTVEMMIPIAMVPSAITTGKMATWAKADVPLIRPV